MFDKTEFTSFEPCCFGLISAPQVFTKAVAPVSTWAHCCKIPLHCYLDNWVVLAPLRASCLENTKALLLLCPQLGIQSDLIPSQRKLYLGMVWDSQKVLVFPSPEYVSCLQGVVWCFLWHTQFHQFPYGVPCWVIYFP